MRSEELGRISGTTRALAVLGYPARHSLSPRIHNAAFLAAGLDCCYLAMEVKPEEIEAAMRGVRALDFLGVNFTAPHKQTVMPFLDELTPAARIVGAVNTAANRNGHWVGTNTDTDGFRRLLEIHGLYRSGMKAVMLGAGGAARAALYVLGQVAGEVVVLNRTVQRAEELLATLPAGPGCRRAALSPQPGSLSAQLKDCDLLVNSTSVGMHPHEGACPLPETVEIPAGCAVVDMIYMPLRTRLLERAERSGAQAIGGLEMLLYQAVAGFEFWTGVQPDVGVMEAALRSGLRP